MASSSTDDFGSQQPETSVIQPFEVDQRTWLPLDGEGYNLMKKEGRRPFRFKLGGRRDLYLVTTDAGDGSDDDIMIWEHGVLTRDGHEEPWTGLAVTDASGATVAWGSHPMGAAAALPMDAIAVHAPAVLHLAFPAGTTNFRIDARADPVYAKNGSMQVVPFDHPPTEDQLHFVFMRWIFGAPKSWRQKHLMDDAMRIGSALGNVNSGFDVENTFDDPVNLLPSDVRDHWGLRSSHLTPESAYGDNFPYSWPAIYAMYRGTSTLLTKYATDAMRKAMAHLVDQMRGTIEARDDLSAFLAWLHPAGVGITPYAAPHSPVNQGNRVLNQLENAAQAFTIVPTGRSPEIMKRYQALLEAARTDEERLRGCARDHITEFAAAAWRRKPDPDRISNLLLLYQHGRDEGLGYEAAVKRAFVGVLVSPYFLYREQSSHNQAAPYALSGRELAERLAFVLWGSVPDAELMGAGADGSLQKADGLRHQIARMVADKRIRALAADFAGQLYLFAGFNTYVGPRRHAFPAIHPGHPRGDVSGMHVLLLQPVRRRPSADRHHRCRLHLLECGAGAILRHRWRRRTAVPPRPRRPEAARRHPRHGRGAGARLAAAAHQPDQARELGAVAPPGHASAATSCRRGADLKPGA